MAAIAAIAFSSERRSTNVRAVGPEAASAIAASPARRAASAFASALSAGISPSPISPRPMHSTAIAIVFAVNCPAHVPGPGHAVRSSSSSSFREITPRSCAPTASHMSWIESSRSPSRPARIGPL